jgi:hypothetical protein
VSGVRAGDHPNWEAADRIAELEAICAEQIERERVREVEIAALRRDIDVKVAYAAALEKAADERHDYVTWLQSRYEEASKRATELEAELTAERARVSYRVAQRVISALGRSPRPT